ncbi:MAG: SAM-dependent methyltransferase [Gammaproteobacteria bacterium]|nr:SAM-dependent methyltransferase [Gammaproteobacteria bacterium]
MQLPEPSPAMLANSHQLTNIIAEKIIAQGPISFADYMQMALYYPGLGYYSAGNQKFGPAGDFITAPELSSLFSHTLAHYITERFATLEHQNILEFGAGSGIMAADILLHLAELNQLPEHYYILDLSADLRERQALTLQQKCPELSHHVIWLDRLPEHFSGIILANEVIDAMPVHLFHWHDNQLHERMVNRQNGEFCWKDAPLSAERLATYLAPYLPKLPQPYISEVNLACEAWLQSLSDCIDQAEVLIIDYGFPDTIFYHPQRNTGTLMCHYRHLAHGDPFLWPGLQDITAHVNFSSLAQTAVNVGFSVEEYDTQANFLVHHGILHLAERDDIGEQYILGQALKRLLLPTEMGELFQVLRLRKG